MTVQTKHEAHMGVIEDMYKARTRFNTYLLKKTLEGRKIYTFSSQARLNR